MGNWILITIAVVFLAVPVVIAIIKIIKTLNSDKITFTKDGKSITISTNLGAEDRKKLVNF